MDFEATTQAYLSGQGPLGTDFLRNVGLPPTGSRFETNYFDYRDGLLIAPSVLTPLGALVQQTQLFSREIGSDTVRSLKFPLTSDAAYLTFGIFCYADFFFPSDLTVDPASPLYGPYLARAAATFLKATRLTMNVSNKVYLDSQLFPWANYELPSILHPLANQTANVPFAVSSSTYNEHHRVYLQLSPPIPWPANSNVQINVVTNVPAYVTDLYGAAPNLTETPWNIPIGAELSFNFVGDQIRVIK